MSIQLFDIGQRVRISAAFDILGTATDPSTIVLRLRSPSGLKTTPANSKDATGQYHADIDLNEIGKWAWRWEGTGACNAISEGILMAQASAVL